MTGYQFGKFPLVLQGNTKGCLFHNQAGPPFLRCCLGDWGRPSWRRTDYCVKRKYETFFREGRRKRPHLAEKLDAAQKEYEEKFVTLAKGNLDFKINTGRL